MSLLEQIVPIEFRRELGIMLPRGYSLAAELVDRTEFLADSPLGEQTLPYLRIPAISFVAKQIESKVPGLIVKLSKNKTGTYQFAEMRFKNLTITISHQGMANGYLPEIPRPADFRMERARYNGIQVELWGEEPGKFFENLPVSAVLMHTGHRAATDAELIIQDPATDQVIDRLPIDLIYVKAKDAEPVSDYMPKFKQFLDEGNVKDA